MSLRLSDRVYSVSGMLRISEDHVRYGHGVLSAGARFGLPWFAAGMMGEVLACRLATNRSAVARLDGDRHWTSLDSIGCVAVGYGASIVIGQKRPV